MRLWLVVAFVAAFVVACAPAAPSYERALDEARTVASDDTGADAVEPAPANPDPNAVVRVPRPAPPPGPRRIGLQAGHWKTDEVPSELKRLVTMTGTSGGGVNEWQLNLDVANRVADALRARGYAVDVLPTTIPPGYLAEAFVSLHADGSTDPGARGFKGAHSSRRGPYEDALLASILDEYGAATNLPRDDAITNAMRNYYAFNWRRYKSTVAPHTPAVILEMGFLTSPADRAVLLGRRDLVADAIARGIGRFLESVPPGAAYAEDIVVPARGPGR
jgi:N-acetylmuramoyl-L-alanine amidase